jgi:exosome complex exonuclease RRP6
MGVKPMSNFVPQFSLVSIAAMDTTKEPQSQLQPQPQPQPQQKPFLEGFPTFDPFAQSVFEKLIEATKISNSIPSSDEYNYYNTFRPFKDQIALLGKRLLSLAHRLLEQKKPSAPVLATIDDVTESFDSVVDIVDELIEEVDNFVDEYTGEKEKTQKVIAKTATLVSKGRPDTYLFYGSNILRPQEKWKDEIDNSYAPFIPRIFEKPNALVPLDPIFLNRSEKKTAESSTLTKEMDAHLNNLGLGSQTQAIGAYPHPYQYELDHFQWDEEKLQLRPIQPFKSLEETPYEWIDTPEALHKLLDKLNNCTEIAVDLEHHAYRSYQGFTCLLQISTRTEDYVIDAIQLRKHLYLLNRPFTNPNIVKVLHGSDMDLMWLQRDFGVYVVNLFDTGQAARVFEFPSYSLAFLLKHYCDYTPQKQYQLADWRIRPLPLELIQYARSDTHYLLYIFDRMWNEALTRDQMKKNTLLAIINRSKELCYKKYEKESFQSDGWRKLYNKTSVSFTQSQLRVCAALFAWRDKVARLEDESTRYVLPNHMLLTISELMPTDVNGLLACCHPIAPPLVRVHAHEIVAIIKRAIDAEDISLSQPLSLLLSPPTLQSPPQSHHNTNDNRNVSPLRADSQTVTPPNQKSPSSVVSTPTGSNFSYSCAQDPSILWDEAGWVEDPMLVTTPSQKVHLATQNADYNSSIPFDTSLFAESTDESSDSEDEYKKTAEAIMKSFGVDFLKPIQFVEPLTGKKAQSTNVESFVSMSTVTSESVSVANTVADTTTTSYTSPLTLNSASADNQSTKNAVMSSNKTFEIQSSQQQQQQQQPPKMEETLSDDLEGIPLSLAEIYKLSSQSRKRKKQKKKQRNETEKQTLPTSFNPQEGEAEIETRSPNKLQSNREDDKESLQLMKEIGWVDQGTVVNVDTESDGDNENKSDNDNNNNNNDDDTATINTSSCSQQQHQSSNEEKLNKSEQRKSRSKSSKTTQTQFVPFDYNNMDNIFAAAPQQHSGYSPYSSIKDLSSIRARGGVRSGRRSVGGNRSNIATNFRRGNPQQYRSSFNKQ